MAFDPTDVEAAGKTQLKDSYKDIFPRAPLLENTRSGQSHFAEEAHIDEHEDRPMPTRLKGCL